MNATKTTGNAFLVNFYPGYSVAVKVGGKTMVHERRFTNKAEATILSMKVSSKGTIDATRWTEQEVAPFIMFRAA
jgi:hypothetical protein